MLKPFYQGKLDAFCAIYAVLNALRLVHGIRTDKARTFFNDTLLHLAATPHKFQDVLNQKTDYVELVENLLAMIKTRIPIGVEKPFAQGSIYSPEEFWSACMRWLNCGDDKRAVVFRFLRFIQPGKDPLNRHWTTADKIDDNILHLFDCSHEAEAILNIKHGSFVTRYCDITREKLLLIQPENTYFLRLPF